MKYNKEDERHIVCIVRGKPEFHEQVKSIVMGFAAPARKEPGCIYYDVYRKSDEPNTFYIIDGWINEDAVDAHKIHPHVVEHVKTLLPLLSAPLEITISYRLSDA